VAVLARVVRAVDAGVVAVPPLVAQRDWARALTVLHAAAREADGRAEAPPSMVVIDTHLARGASNGGFTFHDRGGPYGRTKGAKRVVAVDVTGLPVGALAVPASTHENRTSELMLEHLTEQGVTGRLELVLVDRGVTASAARTLGRNHDLEVRRVGWDDKQPVFRPIRHAWRVEVAHGRLGRSRRLAKSFENTTTSRDGLAPGRLHRHHPAASLTRSGPAPTPWGGRMRGTWLGRLRGRLSVRACEEIGLSPSDLFARLSP
jgi:hypothetical protein